MGCIWDSDRNLWYCYKNNYCYTDGSLSQYLYLIELNNVRFPHDNLLAGDGILKSESFGFSFRTHTFLMNRSMLSILLEMVSISFFDLLVTIYFLRFDFDCSVGRPQFGNQMVLNPPPNGELPLPLTIAPVLFCLHQLCHRQLHVKLNVVFT